MPDHGHRLIISISLNNLPPGAPSEEAADQYAKDLALSYIKEIDKANIFPPQPDRVKITLIREGDRSALNLLLPKVQGRFGEHYQGRKATLKEIT